METNGNTIDPEMPALVREKPTMSDQKMSSSGGKEGLSTAAGESGGGGAGGGGPDPDRNGIPHGDDHINNSKDSNNSTASTATTTTTTTSTASGGGKKAKEPVLEREDGSLEDERRDIRMEEEEEEDEISAPEIDLQEDIEELRRLEEKKKKTSGGQQQQDKQEVVTSSGGTNKKSEEGDVVQKEESSSSAAGVETKEEEEEEEDEEELVELIEIDGKQTEEVDLDESLTKESSAGDGSQQEVRESMDSSAAIAAEESSNTETSTGRKERKKRKTRSELDRLLMDEGTVKILMGPTPRGAKPVSKEEQLEALNKNREEAINQVRDSSKTKLFSKISLRLKSKNRRQIQQEQREAKKAKLSEPASKIIRRRSSSSNFNFSSRSPSPAQLGGEQASIQSSEEDTVQVRVEGSVGYITIDADAVTFNSQITSRLTAILNSLKQNDSVTVVQLTTAKTGHFIQGLDIQAIRAETDDSLREPMADSMVACLDSLLKTLINYPKLLIAGVSGTAVDFGVLLLSYFDLVYASDKATFQTNYVKHGYLPECLQLLPKNRLTHAMLYTGKKLTTTEGITSGLVTEAFSQSKFQDELATRIKNISSGNQEGKELLEYSPANADMVTKLKSSTSGSLPTEQNSSTSHDRSAMEFYLEILQ